MDLFQKLATELSLSVKQIAQAVDLIDNGATVPFIARYRKEMTGGMTDTQLRLLESSLTRLRNLEARRQVIVKSITEQGKLTPELTSAIAAADDLASLEDLYLPYKPKRRTKAMQAREAGLEPLLQAILNDQSQDPLQLAANYLNPEHNITTPAQALEGAMHILMEQIAEDANLLKVLRALVWQHGVLASKVSPGKEEAGQKFSDYFAYEESLQKVPSHRTLALLRGQREEVLQLKLVLADDINQQCLAHIQAAIGVNEKTTPATQWLQHAIDMAWRIKLFFKFEVECIIKLKEQAEEDALKVFANNLNHLLMAAPAGAKVTMGLDPGYRTGVKAVVIDKTGKLLTYFVIYPHNPQDQWQEALLKLAKCCQTYQVELISIGNGTASRETDKLVAELKQKFPDLKLTSLVVSEAGASVYSASEFAANEFPDLDVSFRGAVSIARRLQDPLAELVKIDPKSIGVGQYQHDVNQTQLAKALRAVMEDCVNSVGVDVNTASVPLLSCIAGLNESTAKNIIAFRETKGAFSDRSQLKAVPRFGDKAYEQAAGFLRINTGSNPLDRSAVHPEAYQIVETILEKHKKDIRDVIGNKEFLKRLNPSEFTTEQFGLPTVMDILNELEKPGRDPRPEFKTAQFKEDIHTLADLKQGMILEGVVMNVASFGAFVDIGVHQDGLVHISALANHFVKDPHQVVKVGDIVKVKVLEVDIARKRIQLSMRLNDDAPQNNMSKMPAKKKSTPTSAPANVTLKEQFLQALKAKQ